MAASPVTKAGPYQRYWTAATGTSRNPLQSDQIDRGRRRTFCYRPAPVHGRQGRLAPLLAAIAAGVLVTTSTSSPGGAETVPSLHAEAAQLRRAEQAALLQLYAGASSLTRARVEVERLETRSRGLAAAEEAARQQTEVVRRSLAASQERVARTLRELYVEEAIDPIAVILGAGSLDEAITGIESLRGAAEHNRGLVTEARRRAQRLRSSRAHLAERRRALDAARAAARDAAGRLGRAVAAQERTVSTLRRRGDLARDRIVQLHDRAREAERESAKIAAATVTAARATATPVASAGSESSAPHTAPQPASISTPGTRRLVVDAVAYHLPGTTASGLPVGVGVIAVDPSVIALGTRLFVPGYGPAVAADVGPAIKGNIIDLWMPTAAQARGWGRRTVTITVYGS